jgi:hypothetical protein
MGSDIDRRKEYASRTKPLTGWEAVKGIVRGLATVGFAVLWTVLWVGAASGLFKLIGCLGLFVMYRGVKSIVDAVRGKVAMREYGRAFTSAEAKVLDCYFERHSDNYGNTYYTYYVAVQFDADRKPTTLVAKVSKQVYEAARQDETLAVHYADADPHVCLLEGE